MNIIKKKILPMIKKVLGKKAFGLDMYAAKKHKKGKSIDIFNRKKEYVATVHPDDLGMDFKTVVEDVEYDEITEQNELGIGRPKIKEFKIKKNKVKYTMSPVDEPHWYFLPYLTAGEMKSFLNNIDVMGDVTDIISKLIRGECVSVLVPENREPHIKKILTGGEGANPYHKATVEERQNLRESLGY